MFTTNDSKRERLFSCHSYLDDLRIISEVILCHVSLLFGYGFLVPAFDKLICYHIHFFFGSDGSELLSVLNNRFWRDAWQVQKPYRKVSRHPHPSKRSHMKEEKCQCNTPLSELIYILSGVKE